MAKRYCRCPNDHCFDRILQCSDCDAHGYQHNACRRLTTPDSAGILSDIDDGTVFKIRKTNAGDRLVPQFKHEVKWKLSQGFAALQFIVSFLGTEGEYVIWNDVTYQTMDEKEWKKRQFCSRSIVTIKHMRCETSVSKIIYNLKAGEGVACFCSGQMTLNNPLYYEKMVDSVVCNRIGWYAALHREDAPLKPPSREAFYAAIAAVEKKKNRSTEAMLECYCARCDMSASALINNLQQGQGVACFCSGHMLLDDPLYYDKMVDSVVCNRIGWYAAFHREDTPLKPPSREAFYAAIAAVEKKKDRSQAIVECYCARCDMSTSTSLHCLNRSHSVACFCSGSMRLADPRYYDKMVDSVVCNRIGWYAAFHREYTPLKPPSREVFYAAIGARVEKGDRRQPAMIECYCVCCDTSTSTSQVHLQQNNGVACDCYNKTENHILKPWLRKLAEMKEYGPVGHNELKYYRKSTKCYCPFDFHIPDIHAIVELDGNIGGGHFHDEPNNDTPTRDLEKEDWALENGYQVFRVLQEDVYRNRKGWDNWLMTKLTIWADQYKRGTSAGKAIHPDDPLYLGGVYARLRNSDQSHETNNTTH